MSDRTNPPVSRYLLDLRNRHFLLLDMFVLCITPLLAVMLRVDGINAIATYWGGLILYIVGAMAIRIGVFYQQGLYGRYWRYASVEELTRIATAVAISSAVVIAVFFGVRIPALGICDTLPTACVLPRSIPFIDSLLVLLAVGATRFSVRSAELWLHRERPDEFTRRVLIMGAGDAGTLIAREMRANPQLGLDPIGFVDDDPYKQGMRIHNIPVLGGRHDIPRLVKELPIDQIIIAMPTAPGKIIREVLDICEQAGIQAKTMPGMYELLDGRVSVSQLRNVDIEDLLRREPVQTDIAAVQELIFDRRVLVTGGGGSIGGELCRQILRCCPSQLIILGHGENSVFEITQQLSRTLLTGLATSSPAPETLRPGAELPSGGLSVVLPASFAGVASVPVIAKDPSLTAQDGHHLASHTAAQPNPHPVSVIPVIADVRFPERVKDVFEQYRPQIVFHAAAHKHVPLMEQNPGEAISNNVLGTYNVVEAALASGVERFVLISTDKAVNPTSIMGATKRAAELIVHCAAGRSGMPYVAVRFGNVLGSRGSVVLTFREQIAAGGPVTVTDPEMVRFFMTIPEAVQLVLQASVLGQGGEVFVLDMGDPVRIVDLARDLIELSGLELGRDIDIIYTGLRPGEKLYEELFVGDEHYERTRHEKIFIATNASTVVPADLEEAVIGLDTAASNGDRATMVRMLQAFVPEYAPPS